MDSLPHITKSYFTSLQCSTISLDTDEASIASQSILIALSAPIARHFLKIASAELSPTVYTVTFALLESFIQIAFVNPNSSFGLIIN